MPNQRPKTVKTFGQLQAGITPMIPGQPERIPWTWYDTVTYVDNTSVTLTAFDTVRTNKVDGNMETGGQIPAPQYFDLYHLGIAFLTDAGVTAIGAAELLTGAINDVRRLIQGSAELVIAQKTYWRGPIYMCPAGGGIQARVASTGTFTASDGERFETVVNGSPDLRNRNNFWGDITIPHNQSFFVRLEWAAAIDTIANISIRLALDGFLYRRVL